VLGSAEQLELGDHGSSAVKPSGRRTHRLNIWSSPGKMGDFMVISVEKMGFTVEKW
jgi:hypothetical protein